MENINDLVLNAILDEDLKKLYEIIFTVDDLDVCNIKNDKGNYAIHAATYVCNVKILEILFTKLVTNDKVDVNQRGEKGRTPLHVVCLVKPSPKAVETLNYLLNNLNANPTLPDQYGKLPREYLTLQSEKTVDDERISLLDNWILTKWDNYLVDVTSDSIIGSSNIGGNGLVFSPSNKEVKNNATSPSNMKKAKEVELLLNTLYSYNNNNNTARELLDNGKQNEGTKGDDVEIFRFKPSFEVAAAANTAINNANTQTDYVANENNNNKQRKEEEEEEKKDGDEHGLCIEIDGVSFMLVERTENEDYREAAISKEKEEEEEEEELNNDDDAYIRKIEFDFGKKSTENDSGEEEEEAQVGEGEANLPTGTMEMKKHANEMDENDKMLLSLFTT